jgi:hypothetical protein
MITNPTKKDNIYLANVAKIGSSKKNIQYIENVLSEEDHKFLLDYVKNADSWKEQPWQARIIESDDLPETVLEKLNDIFKLVHKKSIDLYDVEINRFQKSAIHLVKFVKGFYLKPHVDTLSVEGNHVASVYYINDDYVGGEISFPEYDLKIKPQANSLIIFPGNENYVHEVKKIIDKDRYSSAMWFQFTGSTFNKKAEWYN